MTVVASAGGKATTATARNVGTSAVVLVTPVNVKTSITVLSVDVCLVDSTVRTFELFIYDGSTSTRIRKDCQVGVGGGETVLFPSGLPIPNGSSLRIQASAASSFDVTTVYLQDQSNKQTTGSINTLGTQP